MLGRLSPTDTLRTEPLYLYSMLSIEIETIVPPSSVWPGVAQNDSAVRVSSKKGTQTSSCMPTPVSTIVLGLGIDGPGEG